MVPHDPPTHITVWGATSVVECRSARSSGLSLLLKDLILAYTVVMMVGLHRCLSEWCGFSLIKDSTTEPPNSNIVLNLQLRISLHLQLRKWNTSQELH